MANILVTGTGNVAMRSGLELVRLGHKVTCLQEQAGAKASLLSRNLNLELTTDNKKAYEDSSIIFIDVDIPILADDHVDMSEVEGILTEITEYVNDDFMLVINSAVPVGTNRWIQDQLREKLSNTSIKFDVVSKTDMDDINGKIVIGARCEKSAETLEALYKPYWHKIMHTTPENAEFFNYDLADAN
ncbi:hypothetical protein ACTWQL_14640 [Pseudalkalibacillus sp. R45]|uniref:hypothetical protein n=1 Tax=Pseudalkalibacillus sp. R45 TaxID=3457433 RepID=UPI003FCD760E